MFNFFGSKKSPVQSGGINAKEVKKFSFEKYVDPTGEFSSKELKYSFWYVEHKVLLYKLSLIGLVFFIVVSWGFSLWWWGYYLFYGVVQDQSVEKALARFKNFSSFNSVYNPIPIAVVNTHVLPGGVDKYDVLAEVVNSNQRFLAAFDYYFIVDGVKTSVQRAVLLPGEDKFFGNFGLKSSAAPGAPEFILENISWERISNLTVPNVKQWQDDHLHFSISDFEFTRAESTEGAGGHIVKFKLTNNSPYDYATPKFYVALYFQQSLVGVFPITVQRFKSLETRNIDLRSFVSNLQVSDIEVFPLINIYDPDVYVAPGR
jgi:hypothetical protein